MPFNTCPVLLSDLSHFALTLPVSHRMEMLSAKANRQVPMEVLALGLPRTGTATMAQALTQLGYAHCAHGMDMLDDESYAKRWEPILDIKCSGRAKALGRAEFDDLLGHCGSVTDMPCVMLWRELHVAYPEAKVVLVQRNEDDWYRSFSTGVIEPTFSAAGWFNRCCIEPVLGTRLGAVSLKCLQMHFGMDEASMKSSAREVYRKHYDDIRASIPRDQLLEFSLSNGWRPLCEFLNVDVPQVGFPCLNDSEALEARIEKYRLKKRAELKRAIFFKWLPCIVITAAAYHSWRGNSIAVSL